jgi:hypothetical protein
LTHTAKELASKGSEASPGAKRKMSTARSCGSTTPGAGCIRAIMAEQIATRIAGDVGLLVRRFVVM